MDKKKEVKICGGIRMTPTNMKKDLEKLNKRGG